MIHEKQGNGYYVKVNSQSGEVFYQIGTMLYSANVYFKHGLPLTDYDVTEIFDDVKKQAESYFNLKKSEEKEKLRIERERKKKHDKAIDDLKTHYPKSKLTTEDAEFLLKLKNFADKTMSIYHNRVKHYKSYEDEEDSSDYVWDVHSLKRDFDELLDAESNTSYQTGFNDGYSDGYNGYDSRNESHNADYDLGYNAGMFEGQRDS